MTTSELSLRDVSLSFGPRAVLTRQNLDVRRGECVVLIGPSGAGKSVVLKLLSGLLEPTSGEVRAAGRDLRAMSRLERAALRLRCGMLFQKNALFDSLDAGGNVAFPLREKSRRTETEIAASVARWLGAVGLADARDRFPQDLSGGMQKRLGIARALALEPEIVFYDDPTAGLDPITGRSIAALIDGLRRAGGTTVVAVTNDMARARQLADRVVLVAGGELIDAGDPKGALSHADPRVRDFVRGRPR